MLSPAVIRDRLRGSQIRPVDARMKFPDGARLPDEVIRRYMTDLRPAGVLIPIFCQDDGLSVLLTQRSAELKHHAAQVSFPGGRQEESDRDVEAAALRETQEEVGIDPSQIEVAGYLDTMPTITGYAVTPVVGLIESEPALTIDKSEVDYAFRVPLDFFMSRANDVVVEREVQDHTVALTEFHWRNERIWGATAQMILMLRNSLLNK